MPLPSAPLPDEWTEADLEHAMFVAPRGARIAVPGTRTEERPGWHRITTPSFRNGGMNEVLFSALDASEADAIIERTIAEYAALGLMFRWTVPPGSAPDDLETRLAAHGLQRQELFAMYRTTAGVPLDTTPGITVEPATVATIDELTRVMAAGWSMDPGPLDDYHRRVLADPTKCHRYFLARRDGVAAGVGYYLALPRSAHLMGAVVLPAHRGHGLYRALVFARLHDASRHGLELATCHARAHTSAPILRHLGFETACTFPTFSGPP